MSEFVTSEDIQKLREAIAQQIVMPNGYNLFYDHEVWSCAKDELELLYMVYRLQGCGFTCVDLNSGGIVVKGPRYVIRKDGFNKDYASGFQRKTAWKRFLGWTNEF